MENSCNLPLLGLVLLFVILYFMVSKNEGFSDSGLAISDRYCTALADVYYRPSVKNPVCRDNYRERICGKARRNMVDFRTGNYYTENGQLL